MNRIFVLIACCVTFLMTGCTSIKVKPVDSSLVIKDICIVENKKVKVRDFVAIVQDRLRYHNIRSKLVNEVDSQDCEFVMTYHALRSWDLVTYLSHAELNLTQNQIQIANAVYHLRGKGGLAFTKWDSTVDKMYPVVDKLLNKDY